MHLLCFFTPTLRSRTSDVPSRASIAPCAMHRRTLSRPLAQRRRQQSLPAACGPGLVPCACFAAVGWLCICRCASSDEAAPPLLARFIVLVGGCCPFSSVELCDCAEPTVTGPDPASLSVLALPVLQGPA